MAHTISVQKLDALELSKEENADVELTPELVTEILRSAMYVTAAFRDGWAVYEGDPEASEPTKEESNEEVQDTGD